MGRGEGRVVDIGSEGVDICLKLWGLGKVDRDVKDIGSSLGFLVFRDLRRES